MIVRPLDSTMLLAASRHEHHRKVIHAAYPSCVPKVDEMQHTFIGDMLTVFVFLTYCFCTSEARWALGLGRMMCHSAAACTRMRRAGGHTHRTRNVSVCGTLHRYMLRNVFLARLIRARAPSRTITRLSSRVQDSPSRRWGLVYSLRTDSHRRASARDVRARMDVARWRRRVRARGGEQ